MKLALLALLLSLPALGQDFTAKFTEAQSHAPKGYPTLFLVTSASVTPGSLGEAQECVMNIETLGQSYFVVGVPGLVSACKPYPPGTALFGHVHQLLGQVVDLVNPAEQVAGEKKLKSHRYMVRDVTLLNPATQR